MNTHQLKPDIGCVVCGRLLTEVGGRRITAQALRGMVISSEVRTEADHENFRCCIPLSDQPDVYLTVWGEPEIMTEAVIQQIKKTFLKGLHPWICQAKGCGNRQCPECGMAINLPVASDLIYDDGRATHLMVIPADAGCTNVKCSRYRKFDEDWEIVEVK